jgi:hypothetical protein
MTIIKTSYPPNFIANDKSRTVIFSSKHESRSKTKYSLWCCDENMCSFINFNTIAIMSFVNPRLKVDPSKLNSKYLQSLTYQKISEFSLSAPFWNVKIDESEAKLWPMKNSWFHTISIVDFRVDEYLCPPTVTVYYLLSIHDMSWHFGLLARTNV